MVSRSYTFHLRHVVGWGESLNVAFAEPQWGDILTHTHTHTHAYARTRANAHSQTFTHTHAFAGGPQHSMHSYGGKDA